MQIVIHERLDRMEMSSYTWVIYTKGKKADKEMTTGAQFTNMV